MAELTWNAVGDRMFHAGVERGVLYLPEKAVPWNGLTGVDEIFNRESKPFYLDGIKYLDHIVMGEFAATLKAFTYPEEFEEVLGSATKGKGLHFHDQAPKSFNLSYRTRIGNDTDGIDHGYELHLLYNLRAIPSNKSFSTIGGQVAPLEFSFALSSTPSHFPGYRPTAHLSIKSTEVSTGALGLLEALLYGNALSNPEFPSMGDVVDIIDNPVVITDNGDGTWTATGSERTVQLLSDTVFQIEGADVVIFDDGTYEVQTTET